MSEGFEKLKLIGVQRIHQDTHITREYITAVLNSDFEALNKVQFLGFVSIFEREYNLDLADLKAEGLEHFQELPSEDKSQSGVFVVAKSNKKSTLPLVFIALIIMLTAAFFGLDFSSQKDSVEVQNVENEIILDVKKEIDAIANETNTSDLNETITQDENLTTKPDEELETIVEPEAETVSLGEFSIIPKSKVWLGYIDAKSNLKYQETIRNKFTLKRDKEWLLILGHSYADFNVNGEKVSFSTKGNLYLHYKDGKIEKISANEFKKLNRGRKW